MKTTLSLLALLAATAPAYAAEAAQPQRVGLLMLLFLVFGAVIVVRQVVPAATLFTSMIRDVFSRRKEIAGSSK